MPPRAAGPSAAQERAEELSGVGRWSIDLTTGVLTTNLAARTLLGWSDADGMPALSDFLDAVHPGDRQILATVSDRLVRTGQAYVVEHRVVLPGGRQLFLRASATAELDERGRPCVLFGVTLDITDLRHAALENGRQRDRHSTVLQSLSDGYLLAVAGVIVEVNEALCRMTGFSEGELVGAATPYPFWPDDLGPERPKQARPGGDRAVLSAARKDGSRFAVAMTATELPVVDGIVTRVVLLRDVTDEQERANELEVRAATDPLTGVRNSRAFREELREQICRAAADGSALSLALLDIDHFKAVNDLHGHAVGDEVLVAVVERLRIAIAKAGTLARVGGEEFAVLLPGFDELEAGVVVESALAALRGSPVTTVGTVSASAGVAQLAAGMTDGELYRLADSRMYEAKRRGRDQLR